MELTYGVLDDLHGRGGPSLILKSLEAALAGLKGSDHTTKERTHGDVGPCDEGRVEGSPVAGGAGRVVPTIRTIPA